MTGRTSSRPSRGGRAGSARRSSATAPCAGSSASSRRRTPGRCSRWRAPAASPPRAVDAAFALLARGECVVTDRLHGHLLATLLGRPSVVCDNSFGKVRSFYETWTQPLPGCAWAETPAGAEAVLDRLLSRG